MNTLNLVILILFIAISISAFYLFSYRRQVNEIMKKEGKVFNNNIMTFRNFKMIYYVYRNSNNINLYEKKILKDYFIASIVSLIIYIIFVYMIFGTDW